MNLLFGIVLIFLGFNCCLVESNHRLSLFDYGPILASCIYKNGIQLHHFYDARHIKKSLYNSSNTIRFFNYCLDKEYALFLENDIIKKAQIIIGNQHFIINETSDFVDGNVSAFGLDCVHELIYYYDNKCFCIKVFHITDPIKSLIIYRTRGRVTDIRVDPMKGLLFLSEWNNKEEKAAIIRANQDGSGATYLLKNYAFKETPILAIDSMNQRLFFIDKLEYNLGFTDYSGNYKIILRNEKQYLRIANSMDVFGDRICWAFFKSIYCTLIDSVSGNKPERVVGYDNHVDCLTIFDTSKRPIARNRCFENGCKDLCLPSGQNYKCVGKSEINMTDNILYDASSDEYSTVSQTPQTLLLDLAHNTTKEVRSDNNSTVDLKTRITSDTSNVEEDSQYVSPFHWSIVATVISTVVLFVSIVSYLCWKKNKQGEAYQQNENRSALLP